MKKYLAFTLGVVAVQAMAVTNLQTEQEIQPKLILQVIDTSGQAPAPVEAGKYTIGKKQELCWTAFDMPFLPNNTVTEVFTSPARTKFIVPTAEYKSTENGLEHTIVSRSTAFNNGEFERRCWRFDESDPAGKYSVTVRINDIIFPAQTVEVVTEKK